MPHPFTISSKALGRPGAGENVLGQTKSVRGDPQLPSRRVVKGGAPSAGNRARTRRCTLVTSAQHCLGHRFPLGQGSSTYTLMHKTVPAGKENSRLSLRAYGTIWHIEHTKACMSIIGNNRRVGLASGHKIGARKSVLICSQQQRTDDKTPPVSWAVAYRGLYP